MVIRGFRALVLAVLKVSAEPPDPPAGSHASVHVYRAADAYWRYKLIVSLLLTGPVWLGLVVALVAALAAAEPVAVAVVVGMLPAFSLAQLAILVAMRMDFELRYYIVTDRSLRVREGAIIVREMTVTHANVQNIHVAQGPIQRALGIADLVVQTAGGGAAAPGHGAAGSAHALRMAGIRDAPAVRDLVLGFLRAHGGAGLGDLDDPRGRGAPAVDAALLRSVRDAAVALREAAGARPAAP
jgi:membrane protein YdbS with pleckstrin-like domain